MYLVVKIKCTPCESLFVRLKVFWLDIWPHFQRAPKKNRISSLSLYILHFFSAAQFNSEPVTYASAKNLKFFPLLK